MMSLNLCFSQTVLDNRIEISTPKSLYTFLTEVEKSQPVKFFFLEEWIEFYSVDEKLNGKTLRSILDEVLTGSDVTYTFLFDYAIIFSKDASLDLQREAILKHAAESRKAIETITLGERKKDFIPGRNVTIRGTVRSEADESLMSAVTVFVSDLNINTATDKNGQYSITIPSGEHVVHFQHLNYSEKVLDLKAYKSGVINMILHETPTILSEIEVSDQAILTSRVSQTSLQITDIKRAPAFLGEPDVIKNLQLQPGVTTVGEIAGGFNVRGGTVDQNLVLYDGTPIFNTSHALGFFTAFNTDNLSNVSFYRGGIPAEFGGRASSVLNITSKEGNSKKWAGSGGIGIISSYFSIGGPIKRDTTTVIASFRSSYSNWMLNIIKSDYQELYNSSVAFYDGSIKLAHKFSSKTKLTFSGYSSYDEFSLSNDTLYSWSNFAGSLKLDHAHNEKLFSSITLATGKYSYALSESDPENAFKLNYGVIYPSLNFDSNYNGAHSLSFGWHNTFYSFDPGKLRPTAPESTSANIVMPKENALESALYFSDGFYLRDNIFIEAGLRYSVYNRMGPATVFNYEPGQPIHEQNTVDSTAYGNNEIIKTYHGAEPRASLRYVIDSRSSVKVGYNRMRQYLHLITNTAAVTPVDIWQSSNTYFKPQIADQLSIGYYRSSRDNVIEAFLEGYYKTTNNVLDFRDGADLILNPRLETALLPGKALAYGAEVSLTKGKGRLQGFVNYTFSRSFRMIDGKADDEKINEGKYYRSNSDQPHVANFNWRYGFSRRHFFSGNFTYHTGRPMSIPTSVYSVDGVPVADFSERNTYRIPDYHRLDIAFIIEGNHKIKKPWSGNWVISFYNVYARKNPYSVYYQEINGRLVPFKLSIIGTIIPSVTYTFKF
jgi:hypothetical protein